MGGPALKGRLSLLPVRWLWRMPGRKLIWEPRHSGTYRTALPVPRKNSGYGYATVELAGAGKQVYTATRVRVTFDGIPGETPDKFSLTGQAEGINLQIMDNYGYPARAGKSMPPLILRGNEDGLDYSLRIVRNGYPLKAGDYYAALRFKLDYE